MLDRALLLVGELSLDVSDTARFDWRVNQWAASHTPGEHSLQQLGHWTWLKRKSGGRREMCGWTMAESWLHTQKFWVSPLSCSVAESLSRPSDISWAIHRLSPAHCRSQAAFRPTGLQGPPAASSGTPGHLAGAGTRTARGGGATSRLRLSYGMLLHAGGGSQHPFSTVRFHGTCLQLAGQVPQMKQLMAVELDRQAWEAMDLCSPTGGPTP